MISHFDAVAANSARVLAAAAHMGMPIAATEQYPKYLSLFLVLSDPRAYDQVYPSSGVSGPQFPS